MGEFDKDPTIEPGSQEYKDLTGQLEAQRAAVDQATQARLKSLREVAEHSHLAPSREVIDRMAQNKLDEQNNASV